MRRRHIGRVALDGVDRAGVIRNFEGLGYVLERPTKVLGWPVVPRHPQEAVLVNRDIAVVVVAQCLVAGDPGKCAQHALVLRKVARSVTS